MTAELVEKFRADLSAIEPDAIVEKWLLTPGAAHLPDTDIEHIRTRLCSQFRADPAKTWVGITGSAKLGFSITGAHSKTRYRPFSSDSDIDVAVIAPEIFDLVWNDLSRHAHRNLRFPPNAGRLGDYLTAGWLRPDHFPKYVRLTSCDNWWDVFRTLSSQSRFKYRKVRGGLFYSRDQLIMYMKRAVEDCVSAEDLK